MEFCRLHLRSAVEPANLDIRPVDPTKAVVESWLSMGLIRGTRRAQEAAKCRSRNQEVAEGEKNHEVSLSYGFFFFALSLYGLLKLELAAIGSHLPCIQAAVNRKIPKLLTNMSSIHPSTCSTMLVYRGKINWLKSAVNETCTFVFPKGFAVGDPVYTAWQWTENSSGDPKANHFVEGHINTDYVLNGKRTIRFHEENYRHDGVFDATISSDEKSIVVTMVKNQDGKEKKA
ncbi:hypothetical protein AXG93_221s1080 [Marchantia polymorpha subsp. ruderalis]|uniref:Uncharacterized protein n=1 Tax=Marchantia polymorpha subsp. ruderalis TaxID=1480154 RepID=A0A176VKU6_MARPO|nr:hypothetical protein AXG93_221s1080 [Marchantia polymorpha subsp. ruderalis]